MCSLRTLAGVSGKLPLSSLNCYNFLPIFFLSSVKVNPKSTGFTAHERKAAYSYQQTALVWYFCIWTACAHWNFFIGCQLDSILLKISLGYRPSFFGTRNLLNGEHSCSYTRAYTTTYTVFTFTYRPIPRTACFFWFLTGLAYYNMVIARFFEML